MAEERRFSSSPIRGRHAVLAMILTPLVTLVAGALSLSEIGKTYECETIDWRLRWCGRALWSPEVVTVRMDQTTLELYPEFGWPIPRNAYARFIEGVMSAGARTVGIDIVFAFPDKFDPANDEALVDALRRHGDRVVLGVSAPADSENNPESFWDGMRRETVPLKTDHVYRPMEIFAGHCHAGHLEVRPDVDGVVRRLPLVMECEGKNTPAMSMAVSMSYLEIPPQDFEVGDLEVRAGHGPSTLRVPTDNRCCVTPRCMYCGHEKGPRFSFGRLLAAIDGDDDALDGQTLEDIVEGKIVLVGMGDIVPDIAATPWAPITEGVDLHAAFVTGILNGKTARLWPDSAGFLLLIPLAFALAMSALALPLVRGIVTLASGIIGYLIVTVLVLTFGGIVMPLVGPTIGMALASGPVLFGRTVTGERWRTAGEREFQKARMIQQMLLPKGPPAIPGIDLFGSLNPCLQVAGDSYDYFPVGSNQLAVSVGDVAGKGLPAAMLMSNIQGRVRTEAPHLISPARVMSAVNQACSQVLDPASYATVAFAVLDMDKKQIVSCLAGHCHPLIVGRDGSTRWLKVGGPPVGMLADVPYEEERVDWGKGDTVVFYTDGITEAADSHGRFYDETRLEGILAENAGRSAEAMARILLADVEQFTHRAPPSDDRTLLIIRMA